MLCNTEAASATKESITRPFEAQARSRKMAALRGDIRASYDRIDPAGRTQVLSVRVPSAKVAAFGAEAPDNPNACHMRVHFEDNEAGRSAGLPLSVFCKGSQSLGVRLLNAQCDPGRGAIIFCNPIRHLSDVPIPEAIHCACDGEMHNSTIVMKDLDLEGTAFYRPGTAIVRSRLGTTTRISRTGTFLARDSQGWPIGRPSASGPHTAKACSLRFRGGRAASSMTTVSSLTRWEMPLRLLAGSPMRLTI